jgi:hypothetical protein
MAALLSATAENPAFAWDLNMNSLFRFEFESRKNKKIFLASSIAVFDQQLRKKTRHNTRYGAFNGLRNK